jgi:regulator of sigma E protease
MNLLPFPALDGGRLIVLLIELVIRRPVNRKVEGYINMAGMLILLAFMAFITVKDIGMIINNLAR